MYSQNGHQGHQQASSDSPPAKRLKSNPVITRYPPPPGYVPPPNAQIPAQTWAASSYPADPYAYYQQHYAAYAQQAPAYPGYPAPANGWQQPYGYATQPPYGAPTGYEAQNWQTAGYPQYPPHAQQYQQAPTNGNYLQPPYSAATPHPHGTSASPPADALPPADDQTFVKPGLPSSLTNSARQRTQSATRSVAAESFASDDEEPAHEFDETDFSREASFAKDQDGYSEELSIGITVCYPAKPWKTVLPNTFEEAERDSEAAEPPSRPDEDESISKYFVKAKIAESLASIRESPEWVVAEDDIIFRDLSKASDATITPVADVKADRERPDHDPQSRYPPTEVVHPTGSPAVTPKQATSSPERDASDIKIKDPSDVKNGHQGESDDDSDEDDAMDMGSDSEESSAPEDDVKVVIEAKPKKANGSFGDSQKTPQVAKQQKAGSDKSVSRWRSGLPKYDRSTPEARSRTPPRNDYRRRSPDRSQGYRDPRLRNDDPYHNPYREYTRYNRERDEMRDRQAREQGYRAPADYPPDHDYPPRRHSDDRMPYGPNHAPPPPDYPGHHGPYRAGDFFIDDRRRSDSPRSAHSQHTAPGGDFDARMDDDDTAPHSRGPPGDGPGSGRKRAHDEMERPGSERRRQYDDVTPRLQRHRPKVPDAYSRRYR